MLVMDGAWIHQYFPDLGKQTIEMELEFNRGAGFTKAHDRLPEWMTREPLPPIMRYLMSQLKSWTRYLTGRFATPN